MATPTIPNGEEYFFPVIYEGNGAGQRVGKFVPFTDNGTIANSCIFEKGDSPRLNRTPSGTGTSRRKYTLSLWAKPSLSSSASDERYIITAGAYGGDDAITFDADRTLKYWINGRSNADFKTNRTFKDSSKFYHILVSVDTTQATASDRVKIYVDGDQITSFSLETYPSQNYDGNWGNTVSTNIGSSNSPNRYYNGYLAEVNYVDGSTLTPSTFGVTDTSTGRWIPKALTGITYGTNGFRLEFGTDSALGDDTSGNGNDLSATNLASTDQTTDSPTQLFATLQGTGGTLSEGNLKLVTGNSDFSHHNATLKPRSGKYYAEFTCDSMGRSEVGVVSTLNVPYSSNTTRLPATSDGSVAGYMYYGFNGSVYYTSANASAATYATYTSTDIIGIALDLDNHTVQFFKNNSSQGTISLPNGNYTFAMGDGATGFSGGWTANFGQKSFTYTAPTGFVALQQDNLPETAKGISGLVWTKNRDSTDSNQLYDSSRGKQLVIASNATTAETTVTDGLQKFLAGGQQIEDSNAINTSGESFVSWNWVANGGTTETNTDGSITSTVQANTTAGFSIVEWTGDGGQSTVGHGLSSTPKIVIQKNLDSTSDWWFYTTAIDGSYDYLKLNSTAAKSDYSATAPTSTVFTSHGWGTTSMIGYCWHEVDGFSKFGSYTGNGNADGTFVYTGFKPAWVMVKQSSSSGNNWSITDSKRDPFNPTDKGLLPSSSGAEGTGYTFDFLSNGFKLRLTGTALNGSGSTYFYMAFAEHPFVGDGTSPVTAR